MDTKHTPVTGHEEIAMKIADTTGRMIAAALQHAFDLGFRAAGGQVTPLYPSPRPSVPPVTSGDPAPSSDNNAASPGVAGGADLCPGCGRTIAEHER
jgi:hypothetical protein